MSFAINTTKIGDGILPEPALTALAAAINKSVPLFVRCPVVRSLYADHPCIKLLAEPAVDSTELSPTAAFNWAIQHDLPFAAGYWPQVGLSRPRYDARMSFRLYGLADSPKRLGVVLAPFSHSCNGNIAPPLDWWGPIIATLPDLTSLGAVSDPPLPGTANRRGLPLSDVVLILRSCAVLATVETGLLHLANACCRSVVFLSSATPEKLCRPLVEHVRVIRADRPEHFDQAETIKAINMLLTK